MVDSRKENQKPWKDCRNKARNKKKTKPTYGTWQELKPGHTTGGR